jgi:antitoxin (DNA-binding transcriptional repressor) of toxin-antitoxin stability system
MRLAPLPHSIGIQNADRPAAQLSAFDSRRASWSSRARTRNARIARLSPDRGLDLLRNDGSYVKQMVIGTLLGSCRRW